MKAAIGPNDIITQLQFLFENSTPYLQNHFSADDQFLHGPPCPKKTIGFSCISLTQ